MLDNQEKNINQNIVPKEGRPTCLSSDNTGVGRPSLGYSLRFDQTQINSLIEFALILKKIHVRLMMEGFTISETGKLLPPKDYNAKIDPKDFT
ncbi:MAG: hypothetical protein ACO1PI_10115 [Bacteroidota bacterium]|nr:MAG: hypothetical protein F9K23_09760 [Bacteroidota bacterium]